jgi:HTH-type transcriptional regulator/antitoxin HigA
VKFQPKVIEDQEEYNEARCILLELMTKKERIIEETALLRLIAALIKEFDEKQEKPEPSSPHEILVHLTGFTRYH